MDLNTLTFGVEIECAIPAAALMTEGWTVGGYHAGRGIPGFTGWKATHDGSIGASHPFPVGFSGVEVVSPILRGLDGLNQIARIAEKLRAMGAKVNASCGFHVHVGFDATDTKSLVRLMYLTANVEPGLYAATGSRQRVGNRYCRSIKTGYARMKEPGTVSSLRGIQSKESNVTDRYHVLNLTNLIHGMRPTVEFRIFQGTLNTIKMKAYVQLALGLVQLAVELPRRAKWDAAARGYAFTGGQGEAEVKRMFVMLGWSRNASVSYGKKDKAFGVLEADSLPAAKKLLVQLGRQFDGGPRRDANVEVE